VRCLFPLWGNKRAPASHGGVFFEPLSLMTPHQSPGLFVPPSGEQACVSKPWGNCPRAGQPAYAPLAALAGDLSPRRGDKQCTGRDAPLAALAGDLSSRRGDKQCIPVGHGYTRATPPWPPGLPVSNRLASASRGGILELFSQTTLLWPSGLSVPPPGEQACVSKPWGSIHCAGHPDDAPLAALAGDLSPRRGDRQCTGRDAPMAALAGDLSPRRGDEQVRRGDEQFIRRR
jgi:hypothetical protein